MCLVKKTVEGRRDDASNNLLLLYNIAKVQYTMLIVGLVRLNSLYIHAAIDN